MGIVATEIGKAFRLSTGGFDMSANTGLTLNFTSPTGVALQKTKLTTNAVSAPAVALVNDPELGNQAASTYFEVLTTSTDFTEAGEWKCCGTYADSSPKEYHTLDEYTFTILPACS